MSPVSTLYVLALCVVVLVGLYFLFAPRPPGP